LLAEGEEQFMSAHYYLDDSNYDKVKNLLKVLETNDSVDCCIELKEKDQNITDSDIDFSINTIELSIGRFLDIAR
jgi:hypothetical protein